MRVDAWSGPFAVVTLLLAAAGAMKVHDPAATVGALRALGVPVPPIAVRIGGAIEAVIGIAALITGAPALAVLVALSYLAFTVFVVIARARRLPIGSCGCFGKVDTPPSLVHVVLNVAAMVVAIGAAVSGSAGLVDGFGDLPALGIPYVVLVLTGTYLAFLALTALPQLLALTRAPENA